MAIQLNNLTNMFGQVRPEVQKRLETLIRDINIKNWENAYSLILDGHATLWQYIIYIDKDYPRATSEGKWERLPDREVLLLALELAEKNNCTGKWLVCGEIKEKPATLLDTE